MINITSVAIHDIAFFVQWLWTHLEKIFQSAIAAGLLSVAMVQYRNTKTKLRLDLYDRRFAIYSSALDAYQSLFNSPYEISKQANDDLVRMVREARFLFQDKDGIHELLTEILKNCVHSNYVRGPDSFVAKHGPVSQRAVDATIAIEPQMLELENKMLIYMDFRQVSGWGWPFPNWTSPKRRASVASSDVALPRPID